MTQTDRDTWPSSVSACPYWSPRDMLAHLVGFAANCDRPINDITIHEQDLRGATGVSGGQEAAAAHFVRDPFADRFGESVADLPVVELRGETLRWQSHDEQRPTVVVA